MRSTIPVLLLLLIIILIAASPFSLSGGAEGQGAVPGAALRPGPAQDLSKGASKGRRGEEARLSMRLPLHPLFPIPSAPSLGCNRPAADMPPAPDGCPDWAPVAPPPAPIPPPCIADFHMERWGEEDTAVTELTIYVDHPEISQGTGTYTQLACYQFRNPKSETCSGSGIRNPEWALADADWEASCGKDEGPLAWALLQVLNAGRWDALDIYAAPLPEDPMAILRELAGLRSVVYLPVVAVGLPPGPGAAFQQREGRR